METKPKKNLIPSNNETHEYFSYLNGKTYKQKSTTKTDSNLTYIMVMNFGVYLTI